MIFLIENKKCEKNTFFLPPPINETFLEKHEKWPFLPNTASKSGQKKKEGKVYTHGFFPEMAYFRPFVNKGIKQTKIDQKIGQKKCPISKSKISEFHNFSDPKNSHLWDFSALIELGKI